MKHYPVMLPEVMAALSPVDGETYLDGTFGNGGYSREILSSSDCQLVALDQDPNVEDRAAEFSDKFGSRFRFFQTPFSKMSDVLLPEKVDAVILDVGVSSMQLDQAARGFSFNKAGPLDMRMQQSGPSAADAVNHLPENDLVRIFKVYGEEKKARRAAQLIIRAREADQITTTDRLAGLLESGLGRSGKIHPATRIFQALRIFINDELGELYRGLKAAEDILNPGGRLIVVTFHSLEDRIVKKFMRVRSEKPAAGSRYMPAQADDGFSAVFDLASRSVVKPSNTEILENSRSRSAKLRCAIRTDNPGFTGDESLLPRAPRIEDYRWAA